MVKRILRALGAEDYALLLGVCLVGVGTGIEYGVGFGLLSVGALCTAYGVWITERSR